MPPTPRLRPAVFTARERLAQGRAKIREQHDRGSPGIQVCAHLADLLDEIVLGLYRGALTDTHDEPLESEVALVAIGGYGRRDVAPFSDVDLMLLSSTKAHARAAELAKHLSRDICDAGLTLGFSLRTAWEARSLGMKDSTIFTSLAESRFLCGSQRLFERFMDQYRHAARQRWRRLVAAIVASRRQERRQYGETTYLLEPNIKRSRGGLRDVQTIRWVGFTKFGETDLDSLERTGILTNFDRMRVVQAHEFLLKLRNELHFCAGKSQDVLTRDEQVRVADLYRYEALSGLLPVERFMRDYFEHTGDIRYISSSFIDSVRARSPIVAAVAPLFSHRVEDDFWVGPVHISATRRGLAKVKSDLAEVLRLMDLANMYRKRIDHQTWEAIRHVMAQRPVQEISPEAISRFLSLMSQPGQLADLLRRLHQLRVLEQIIPAMQHARYLMQFNNYHKYTVDEHSIRAVEAATSFLNDPRPVGDAYRDLRNKRLLHLTLLIHDLGKGYEDDHSEVGALIAVETARRLNLSDADAEALRFLVHKHLMMSHMAFREDLHDESIVLRLAREVGTTDVLQMLYILSCADLAAVGPKVLNDWKLELLTDLYFRTRRHLTGEDASQSAEQESRLRRAAVRDLVGNTTDTTWWDQQLAEIPASYLLSLPPQRLFEVLENLRHLGPEQAVAWYQYSAERKVSAYMVGTHESVTPGIFHKLTGALTGKGLQILSAEIHTLADDLVLDRFYVEDTDYAGEPPAHRTSEVCQALVRALTVDADKVPAFRRLWKSGQDSMAAQYAEMPTRIRFDDSTSDRFTIITIFTYDRRGLLYNIARTLFELGLEVHVAKIGTFLDQVVDAFYVTDARGHKIHSQEKLNEIRQRLDDAMAPANGHTT